MSTTVQPPPTLKPRSRRGWWIALGAAAAILSVPVAWMTVTHFTTRSAWDAAAAEAEEDLPRWRLLDMEADREVLPERDNSALHIIAVRRAQGRVAASSAPDYDKIFDNVPPTAQLNKQQAKLVDDELAKIPQAVILARQLKNMPRGRFPITYSDDAIGTLIPDHQEARGVGELLFHDAMLLAHRGKCDDALESCLALLNVGRAMEGDLTLICHLIRVAMREQSTYALERTLAQGQASEKPLKAMQDALLHESRQNHFLTAMRGERAMMNHLFENVRNGKVKGSIFGALTGTLTTRGGKNGPPVAVWLQDQFPSATLQYYPEFLRYLNGAVEVAKLPIHERQTRFENSDTDRKKTRNFLIGLLAPAFSKVHYAECRSQAGLRCAAVALACERYRLAHKDKQWPASLDVLVKEKLLDAVPLDPFDGQPLRFRRTKDGVVVYSVGHDRIDNQGHIQRPWQRDEGVDIGIQLWDVARRRQAAMPIYVPPEDP